MAGFQIRLSLLILLITAPYIARAGDNDRPCLGQAMERLRLADPDVYNDLQRLQTPETFSFFLDCSAGDLDLPSAVHEGLHGISNDDLPLADGERFPLMDEIRIQPREVLPMVQFPKLETFGNYRQTYLQGQASAKEMYFVLLDEFNAYSRELITSVRLVKKGYPNGNQSARDGVAAMMIILKSTVARAQSAHADDWARMQEFLHARAIRALWEQAETGLNDACLIDGMGIDDAAMLDIVYSDENSGPLSQLLGRKPQRPRNCVRTR